MKHRIFSVVHTDAGVVHDVRAFDTHDRAVTYRAELFETLKKQENLPADWTVQDYNVESEATITVCETILYVADPICANVGRDKSIVLQFIREYFSRQDIYIPDITGNVDVIPMPTGLSDEELVEFVSSVTGVIINVTNLRGQLEIAALT